MAARVKVARVEAMAGAREETMGGAETIGLR